MAHLGSILKSAAALQEVSAATIAGATGIRLSRLSRFFSGRTLPTPLEVNSVLRACALDPGLLTNLARYAKVRTSSEKLLRPVLGDEQLFGALLLAGTEICSPVVLGDRLLVDRLTLTFNAVDDDVLLGVLERYAKGVRAGFYYDRVYEVRGVRIEHSTNSVKSTRRSSRVDFLSARSLSGDALRHASPLLSRLFRLVAPGSLRLSRVDVAVDLPVSLRNVQALGSSRQKVSTYLGKGGVETIMFGNRKLDRHTVIYDKRQQTIDGGGSDDGRARTRIEARIKNPGVPLVQLAALSNPFEKLSVLLLRTTGSLVDDLLLSYASFVGFPALRDAVVNGVLDREHFDELHDHATRAAANEGLSHPAAVFDRLWKRRAGSLVKRLEAIGAGL